MSYCSTFICDALETDWLAGGGEDSNLRIKYSCVIEPTVIVSGKEWQQIGAVHDLPSPVGSRLEEPLDDNRGAVELLLSPHPCREACQAPEHTPPGPWPRQVPVP